MLHFLYINVLHISAATHDLHIINKKIARKQLYLYIINLQIAERHAPRVSLLNGEKVAWLVVTKLSRGPYVNMDSDRESLARTISDAESRAV